MKILAISDTHGKLPDMSAYEADVFIHAGDICPNWTFDWIGDGPIQMNWMDSHFFPWLNNIRAKHKLLTLGNHDGIGQFLMELRKQSQEGTHWLIDQSVEIDGVNFWGTPWTYAPFNQAQWAYGKIEKGALKPVWDLIPDKTDVLITHSPPFEILDACPAGKIGCRHLQRRSLSLPQLKLQVFGHAHSNFPKSRKIGNTLFVNAAEQIIEIELSEAATISPKKFWDDNDPSGVTCLPTPPANS